MTKSTIISYTIRPERVGENACLIRAVFDELHVKAPRGLRYLSICNEDGHFVHVVTSADGSPALTDFPAFRAFQRSLSDRCLTRPDMRRIEVVGSYSMMQDDDPARCG